MQPGIRIENGKCGIKNQWIEIVHFIPLNKLNERKILVSEEGFKNEFT